MSEKLIDLVQYVVSTFHQYRKSDYPIQDFDQIKIVGHLRKEPRNSDKRAVKCGYRIRL